MNLPISQYHRFRSNNEENIAQRESVREGDDDSIMWTNSKSARLWRRLEENFKVENCYIRDESQKQRRAEKVEIPQTPVETGSKDKNNRNEDHF